MAKRRRKQEAKGAQQERDIFPYEDFAATHAALKEAVAGGPFYGRVVGPSGTGKSTLLRSLRKDLDRHRHQVVYLTQHRSSPSALGQCLAMALRLSPRRSHAQTSYMLTEALRTMPTRLLLLCDEAHLAGAEMLEELRLLAEGGLDEQPLFSVVFCGLPDLKRRFQSPGLFPLRRRLTVRAELLGLKRREFPAFLQWRFGEEAAARFTEEALDLLFERTRGTPALANDFGSGLTAQGGDRPINADAVTAALDAWEL